MADIKIPIDTVKKDFEDFLNMDDNSRVLFSGKFGLGKTHFLKEFFEEKNDLYEVFHLYPVNYQINNTENITSLLKYDLLVSLLEKNENIFEQKDVKGIKDSTLLFWSWVKERSSINGFLQSTISSGESVASFSPDPITNVLSKLGRPLKSLLEIDKEYQKFKTDYKADDKGIVEKYVSEVEENDITEPDYISYLVKEKISSQKGDKKSILILDDLDRIDPDHIFRLLNLLSAFFEREDENRFGFDVIIVVADYSNLKHIFHHKYGVETDFSGYVSKFFSIVPFYFDNKKAIISAVDHIVKSIKNENPLLFDAIGESGYIKLFLEHIFSRAVESEAINLRELLKATRFQFTELKKGGLADPYGRRDQFRYIFDVAIKVAILSFANTKAFLKVIKTIQEAPRRGSPRMPFDRYITSMVLSLDLKKGNSFYWGKYLITWNNDNEFVTVQEGTIEDLFYDLLQEYLK